MRYLSSLKRFLVVFALTVLALLVLLESGLVDEVSYRAERGRLRARRENLPTAEEMGKLSETSRTVAGVVRLAVVTVETEAVEKGTSERAESLGAGEQGPAASSGGTGESTPTIRQGIGSGFVFNAEKGYVLTNAHVVEGARKVRVYLADRRETEAEVLGSDPDSDLAVLRIPLGRLHDLPFAGQSSVAPGDEVFAVGSPYGLDGSVSKGVISAIDRRDIYVGEHTFASLLQTDAVVTTGNSGGPLVNMRGEVVGINSAMISERGRFDGVGFAIPMWHARQILDDLIDGGPAWLGVLVWSATDPSGRDDVATLGWKKPFGAVVDQVYPKTAAERAGLRPKDIIATVDGVRIDDVDKLGEVLSDREPGTRISAEVHRDGRLMTVPVQLGRRYAPR